jgi:hypothetical protein
MLITAAMARDRPEVTSPNRRLDHGFLLVFNTQLLSNMHRFKVIFGSAKQCCIGDVSFQWGKPIFEGPPTEDPLTDRYQILNKSSPS